MERKKQILEVCREMVHSRMQQLEQRMAEIRQAVFDETKSSVGDKYETGRAMMQLEQEKFAGQLEELLKMKKVVDEIRLTSHEKAELGSLVMTDKGNFFISVSLGPVKVEKNTVLAISPVAPLGQLLMGKQAGEEVRFRTNVYRITSVL